MDALFERNAAIERHVWLSKRLPPYTIQTCGEGGRGIEQNWLDRDFISDPFATLASVLKGGAIYVEVTLTLTQSSTLHTYHRQSTVRGHVDRVC